MDEHWTNGLTHEKLTTPEAKATLSKFGTEEDAHIGYIELQKSAGKPFKLPKSLDSLPDDNVRADFSSQLGKLLGAIEKEDDLKDVNFADGLADVRTVNQDLVSAFKKFAIDNKLPKSLVSKLVSFNNEFGTKFVNAQTAVNEAAKTEKATKVNDALKVLYGGDEGVKKNSENVRRLFKDHCGLTAEEYEKSALSLIESGITQDAILCKAFFNLAKDVVPEGTTETTGAIGPKKDEGSTLKEQMPDTAKALGW